MGLSVAPEHLRRYRDIAWLLWKHGRADWVKSSGLETALRNGERDTGGGPETLTRDLEQLGPTFIKIGQLLASRGDLLPPAYLEALSRLHDKVEPVPFSEIERVLQEELPARPSRAFAEIDARPLAAASLAQVHAARLRDGREVVVKVQRPGVRAEVQRDFEVFVSLAKLGSFTAPVRHYRVEELVEEFKRAIEEELDYRREEENLRTLRDNLSEFKRIQVPAPIPDFCTSRVLTMERVSGTSIAAVSPVVFTEVDGEALASELFSAYLTQILADGFFHADPHPGNVFLTHDHRLALIDLGLVGRIDSQIRHNLLQLIIAVSEGRGREAGDVALQLAETGELLEREQFYERVSSLVMRSQHATVTDLQVGRLVMQIQQIAAEAALRLPRALALVGKTLLNLDQIARLLSPGFNPNEAIRRRTLELVQRRVRERLTPGNVLQSALEATDVVSQLPKRLNELLTQVGKSGIRLDVDAFDEQTFIEGFQKVANRITAGLILAALIIGAALLMRVETPFRLMGYPGLAIILFFAAAFGGAVLLWEIMVVDRKKTR